MGRAVVRKLFHTILYPNVILIRFLFYPKLNNSLIKRVSENVISINDLITFNLNSLLNIV